MIVYVETNFVLELALLQEEAHACEQILILREAGKIKLVLPAYSLIEPYETLHRRNRDRLNLVAPIRHELRQIARSRPYQTDVAAFIPLAELLTRIGQDEKLRLAAVQNHLLNIAEVLPLNDTIIRAAPVYTPLFSTPQDSIVYVSILEHLNNSTEKSCFLNRNEKDFQKGDIQDHLQSLNCRLITNFSDGLQYIQSQLQ